MSVNTSYEAVLSRTSASKVASPSACPICRRSVCYVRTHQDYLRRWGKRQTEKQLLQTISHRAALHRGIHNERANPFAAYPIVMSDRRQELYNQLFSKWNHNFNGPERHLFPFSRYAAILNGGPNDGALLLGLLSVVATQVALIRDGTPDEFALKLQLDVISAQREALSRNSYASDARIQTAMMILSNTLHTDKTADIGDLLAVIKTMLHQRGGVEYLGMSGVITDNLMYTDHLNALLRNELPKFPVTKPYLISRSVLEDQALYHSIHAKGLLTEGSMLAAELFIALVRIYEMAARGLCSGSDRTYFTYLSTAFEHQVCIANAQYHDTDTLDECLVLGLILFDNTVFRNSRDLAPPVLVFERRFWRALRSLRNEDFFQCHQIQHLEYYLVYLGTITSLRRPCPFQTEAIETLAVIRQTDNNNVRDLNELVDVLDQYGWSKTVCFSLFADIWRQSCEHIAAIMDVDSEVAS